MSYKIDLTKEINWEKEGKRARIFVLKDQTHNRKMSYEAAHILIAGMDINDDAIHERFHQLIEEVKKELQQLNIDNNKEILKLNNIEADQQIKKFKITDNAIAGDKIFGGYISRDRISVNGLISKNKLSLKELDRQIKSYEKYVKEQKAKGNK